MTGADPRGPASGRPEDDSGPESAKPLVLILLAVLGLTVFCGAIALIVASSA
ncbi:hypothetical protein HDA32_003808 [Spinactinospora alkalitolerans]|uniref:Uncharacterized protein n=1 Tax=Spinactinospora alkalitolerans TaxID=687207 RepID=A0A852TXL5_9ACTN|nr:hypothetical protein [Spinactinospora alkalitolerans]NYE48688.1 hypothetical protein [Spinactinospora alkalitolerans]